MEFQPGDTVQLKSGGPIMTIASVAKDDGRLWCVWFNQENGKFSDTGAYFRSVVLTKA